MKEQGAAKVMIATCSRQCPDQQPVEYLSLNKLEVNWAESTWQRLMGLSDTGGGGRNWPYSCPARRQ